MFAGINLVHDRLKVLGAGGFANTITVGLSPDQQSVDVNISYTAAHGVPKVIAGAYPLTSIKSLLIFGGARADYIAIDQTNGSFSIPTAIFGEAGNDTIYGGDEPDYVAGGAGNDYVNGGAGNDSLFGNGGNDTLIGGPGDDQLHGSGGRNYLEGDDGNDTLFAAVGHDTLLGGSGNNVFSVQTLKTHPDNDFNKATDKLHIVVFPSDSNSLLNELLGF
jgi:Ca2+-binding RTX toxin-like protein